MRETGAPRLSAPWLPFPGQRGQRQHQRRKTSLPASSSGSSSSRGGRILCLCGDPLRPGTEIFPLPGLCGGAPGYFLQRQAGAPPPMSSEKRRFLNT
ncbi:hypothetical protein NDU88_000435 [Pleurodeles waltl]|uniref:Uncharacterized protein n=1 Tax=Pleurodeles waltl TaxID=8319 RepID=A0AAV7N7Y4_PLEWA|nr:hypothetical protein NDU88_000435 [Pleurodeles waltl]